VLKACCGVLGLLERFVKLAKLLGVVVIAFGATTAAQSATLSLSVGGVAGSLPANFDPSGLAAINADGIHIGTAITIFNTANTGGLLISPQNVTLTFDFMGKEAGFVNQARLTDGTFLFDNHAAPITSSGPLAFSFGSAPVAVPFLFRAPGTLDAINGGAIAAGLQIAFAKVSDTIFYAFFDDGGAGPDKDFDDMVVRITAASTRGGGPGPTPLPAALPLFASGLGALGLVSWRRKRKKAVI
jgi:hypothetical protein